MRKQVADRMEALLDEMAASESSAPEAQLLRDVAVLRSMPGIGRVVSGALLGEAAGPQTTLAGTKRTRCFSVLFDAPRMASVFLKATLQTIELSVAKTLPKMPIDSCSRPAFSPSLEWVNIRHVPRFAAARLLPRSKRKEV
jgi:hypothetical protein